ncbi:MarR family winged helix-turn-helix transcriptional regulator [Gordonia malaquae]|uniref:MarR family winged helix-turn-helix transcriptional regulator n=1 Tax=Gordonia malaquae TaxID=410332 RepID=UPI0030FE8257
MAKMNEITDTSTSIADSGVGPTSRIGALSRRLAILVSDRVLAELADSGQPDIRAVHLRVFAAIADSPLSVTDTARRLGTTKQTVGPIVRELESKGLVSLIRDPADARAYLVSFTDRGRAAALQAQSIADRLDDRFADVIGVDRLADCRAALWELIDQTSWEAPPS